MRSAVGTAPQLAVVEARRSFGWIDGLVMVALLGLLWSALHFGKRSGQTLKARLSTQAVRR